MALAYPRVSGHNRLRHRVHPVPRSDRPVPGHPRGPCRRRIAGALHAVSADLSFTIVVQHVIGLATAVLAYVIARQLGARRWVALIPAAAITLSGDQLYFEYSLLSDGVFLALVLLACSLVLTVPRSGHSATRQFSLTLAAAAVAALSTTVRTVGVALIPVLILWLLRFGGGGRRHRVGLASFAAIVSLAIVLGYAAA